VTNKTIITITVNKRKSLEKIGIGRKEKKKWSNRASPSSPLD
jgi:hypothetical protein